MGFVLPNVVHLDPVLSNDESTLDNDLEEHIRVITEDPYKAFGDAPVQIDVLSDTQKEVLKDIDDNGSNMVKRLLKNYESYQNVLSEKEGAEQIKEELKSSVFMDHFHNVAGTIDKEDSYYTDLKLEDDLVDTAKDKLPVTDETNDFKLTTSNVPDQAQASVDAQPSATTPTYNQENNSDDNDSITTGDNTDDSNEMYDMSKSYTSTMVHNADEIMKADDYTSAHENNLASLENPGNNDNEESSNVDNEESIDSETSEERDARIVNVKGRRRNSGAGPVRISSGSRGNSIDDVFHPRPVYTASSSPGFSSPSSSVFSSPSNSFGGFPSQQNIHTHIHQSEEIFGTGIREDVIEGANNQDVHVHVHMNRPVSEEGVLGDQFNQDPDEVDSMFGWIGELFG
jgi:hypothetical protein